MLRALQTSRGGMLAQQDRVDVLANNLANAATSGFKRVLTGIERNAAGAPEELSARTGLDLSQGPLRATGNPLDFAVAGKGFFVVSTPAGERLTRDGGFHLDPSGRLVNAAGHPVLGTGGPIEVPPGTLEAAGDGSLRVAGEEVGRLRLATVAEPGRLLHEAGNLYRAADGAVLREVPLEEAAVSQGFLEGSNADPVNDLVQLIAAQRIFEAGQRALATSDDSLGRAVNEMGRVR